MEGLAVWLGNFIGAVLAQCAPVLVKILSEAIRNARLETVEESNAPDNLRKRLREFLLLHKDGVSAGRNSNATPTPGDRKSMGV